MQIYCFFKINSIFKIKSTFYRWGNCFLPPVRRRTERRAGRRGSHEPPQSKQFLFHLHLYTNEHSLHRSLVFAGWIADSPEGTEKSLFENYWKTLSKEKRSVSFPNISLPHQLTPLLQELAEEEKARWLSQSKVFYIPHPVTPSISCICFCGSRSRIRRKLGRDEE